MAVMIQNINLVKLLIKYGADVNLQVSHLLFSSNSMMLDKKLLYTMQSKKITFKYQISFSIMGPIHVLAIKDK